MAQPTPAPLIKMPTVFADRDSSSSTLSYVHQAMSLPVNQEEGHALCDGPEVTSRSLAISAGHYCLKLKEKSKLSSRRRSLEPPAPSGTIRETF